MKITRAAFGVMIKFSDLFDVFQQVVDETDLMWEDFKDDADRDTKLREHLKTLPHFEQVAKRWESASKMRQWAQEKKKNLAERIKKEVEAEFTKKKEEEQKKKEEEE